MRWTTRLPLVLVTFLASASADDSPARGPLRVHPDNPRYFTDGERGPSGTLRAVLLTGAHTWNSLVDLGRSDPPEPFDFDAYLDFLLRHGHNFIRLWAWDSTVWDTRANGALGKAEYVHHAAPLPWRRTGPGKALDGKPRFDLTQLDPAYFQRLRQRVKAAGKRGIYVSVMLFEGWGLMHGDHGRAAPNGWAWRSHPFHPDNNVNGTIVETGRGGTGRVHHLGSEALQKLQAAYIQRVVDKVNDLDNVLYEVVNEGGEREWNRWVMATVRERERTLGKERPRLHPIGLTGHGAERLESMFSSDADWVSPGHADGFGDDPPAWNPKGGKEDIQGRQGKVSLLDTDHVWGVGGSAEWAWRAFLRGHNPLFMDPYDGSVLGKPGDERWEPVRRALGAVRRVAEHVDLAAMVPDSARSSTGFCLSTRSAEHLVFQPEPEKAFTVDLAPGSYEIEWLDPLTGDAQRAAGNETGRARLQTVGGALELKMPFAGPAVLHLRRLD